MKTLPIKVTATGALALILSWGISLIANAQSKTLIIYSGREEKLIAPLIEEAKKDLKLNIQVRYGDTAELAVALLEEGKNSRADLFFAQDASALGAMEQRQRTLPIASSLLKQIDSPFRSQQGNWMGISGRARVIDYNTKLVKQGDLPKSVLELTQPKWKGKVGWSPTNGSFQSFVTAMRVTEGDQKTLQWLKAMKANGVKDYGKNTAIIEALGRGEILLGLTNHYYLQRYNKTKPDFPVAHHYTRKDAGAMINVAGIAVLKTTDQRNDAEAFVKYMLSPKAQNYFAEKTTEYPLVRGIKGPANLTPLAQQNPPKINLTKLSDLEGTLKLLQQAGVL